MMKLDSIVTLVLLATLQGCTHAPAQEPPDAHEAAPTDAAEADKGDGNLHVPAEDQEHMGLEFAAPTALDFAAERLAYGRVLSDPARRATLSAPLAGTLLAGEHEPALGAELAAGAVVFRLVPRWTPQERADLASKQATARADLAAVEAELPARRAALERARGLNASDKSVSDRELEETERDLRVAEARMAGTRELLGALVAALGGKEVAPIALVLPTAGEVVELGAHSGETVEAGARLLTVEDFSAPLVALELPLDMPLDGGVSPTVASARIASADGEFLTAERVGIAPSAGAAGLAQALLFRVRPDQPGAHGLRPGLALRAWLPSGASSARGLDIPDAAVVRLAGGAFAYVRRGAESFERRALPLAHPVPGGWFVPADWDGAEALELVVRGAQSLLSFELLGRQGAEEE